MEVFSRFYEDYPVGEKVRSQRRTVEMADLIQFCCYTGDFHPVSMDEEYGKSTGFKTRIIPGALTFSLTLGLTYQNNLEWFTYGHDRLRYLKPIYPGDTISAMAEVIEKCDYPRDPDNRGLLTFKYETVNQHGDLVFVCQHTYLVNKCRTGQKPHPENQADNGSRPAPA